MIQACNSPIRVLRHRQLRSVIGITHVVGSNSGAASAAPNPIPSGGSAPLIPPDPKRLHRRGARRALLLERGGEFGSVAGADGGAGGGDARRQRPGSASFMQMSAAMRSRAEGAMSRGPEQAVPARRRSAPESPHSATVGRSRWVGSLLISSLRIYLLTAKNKSCTHLSALLMRGVF
jgi:hypothetical protein